MMCSNAHSCSDQLWLFPMMEQQDITDYSNGLATKQGFLIFSCMTYDVNLSPKDLSPLK